MKWCEIPIVDLAVSSTVVEPYRAEYETQSCTIKYNDVLFSQQVAKHIGIYELMSTMLCHEADGSLQIGRIHSKS